MSHKLSREPFPRPEKGEGKEAWFAWANRVWWWFRAMEDAEEPPEAPSFAVSTLPRAVTPGLMIFVVDEVGGATLAFSDGTNWRRVQDRAIVS